jgi:hypothetical protein
MPDILADPTITAVGTALLVAVVALWLAAAWWAYRDAARRSESTLAAFFAAGWIILSTPLLLPLSLMAYAFARPQVTASDHRTKGLLRALAAAGEAEPTCAACGAGVDAAWNRCPACSAWLAAPCAACGAWSDPSFEICPWCASDTHAAPNVPDLVDVDAPVPALGDELGRADRPSHRPMSPLRVRV